MEIEIIHEGQARKGYVRDVTTTSVEMVFKVNFEDGYQNTFFIPFGENRWCEWKLGYTLLAQKVGAAIEAAVNTDAWQAVHHVAGYRKAYETELEYEGELLQATFVDISRHHTQNCYFVIFADGYENIFYLRQQNGEWYEKNLGITSLARQIGRAIHLTLRMSR